MAAEKSRNYLAKQFISWQRHTNLKNNVVPFCTFSPKVKQLLMLFEGYQCNWFTFKPYQCWAIAVGKINKIGLLNSLQNIGMRILTMCQNLLIRIGRVLWRNFLLVIKSSVYSNVCALISDLINNSNGVIDIHKRSYKFPLSMKFGDPSY